MDAITFTESRPSEVLAHLHESADAEREYLFASHDAGRDDLIVVAWHADRAIGYLAATEEKPADLLVWEHVVAPEYRQQGVGRRLLLEAAKRTSPEVTVFIDPMGELDLERVVDYYAQFGFVTSAREGSVSASAATILATLGEQREDATSVGRLLGTKSKPGVVTIDPAARIGDALKLMSERGIGAIVASQDGARVEGILSERDVVVGIDTNGAEFLHKTVGECTTTDVVTATTSDLISELMDTMSRKRIRHIPVTDQGKLVGIVSGGDILMFRLRELDTARDDLPRR